MYFITVDEEALRENPVYSKVVERIEAKAEAEGVAESVLDILEERQVEIADVQRERILAVHDREMLRRWLRAAMHVGSVDELFD